MDNASTDGAAEWLKEQEDILLIQNDANEGFAPACNRAVKATAGTEYEDYDVFLLNNDTRLTEGALANLREILYSADDIGAVGSVSNYAGNGQQIDVVFDKVEDYLEYGRRINRMRPVVKELVRLSGFAMLIRKEAWDKAGGFDEDFAPGYFEDDALSMELMKNGYRLMLVKNSFIYHAGSQSFSKTDFNSLLNDHRLLFERKYGFDIIDHAYPDDAMISGLVPHPGTGLRILRVNSGLGADLKAFRSMFPDSECVGFESNKALYEISRHTEKVFDSYESLTESYDKGYFDVLIVNEGFKSEVPQEIKEKVVGLCKPDARLLVSYPGYMSIPYESIKMIIWDLDDTLWNGTLSETGITLSETNIALIRMLTDHGIVNSISSKNDEAPAEDKLKEYGIWDCFVFNNINWDEKGAQIASKIRDMGLRAENVLFMDDNPRNLEEAKHYNDKLMTATPGIIPYLIRYYSQKQPGDLKHTRLAQYKLLERKTEAMTPGVSKEQFLYDSNIRITVNRNCLEEIDRIHEMVSRTNQLNFTKNRDDKTLLTRQITNDWNDCAYIKVRDNFGDYGIVGYYCYNTREKVMEHFLFSCRVLGMGIEQYVYNLLGCPEFEIKQPVAATLAHDKEVPWITESTQEAITEDRIKGNRVRILLKGPCDMSAIEPYLSGANITTEFNYINDRGFVTTGQNHSVHIRESAQLSEDEINEIINEVPFIVKGDFETKIFTEKYHVICYSLIQDLSAGLYKKKGADRYIGFGSRNYDLTSPKYSERFIKKEIQGHGFDFTQEVIDNFSAGWEFVGGISLEQLLDDLDYIYENVPGKPLIILLVGSMIDYEGYNEEFDGLGEIYREINPVIEAFAEDHERIKVIDPTQFIRSQDDFEDCINHFGRNVYYEMAGKICEYINEYL